MRSMATCSVRYSKSKIRGPKHPREVVKNGNSIPNIKVNNNKQRLSTSGIGQPVNDEVNEIVISCIIIVGLKYNYGIYFKRINQKVFILRAKSLHPSTSCWLKPGNLNIIILFRPYHENSMIFLRFPLSLQVHGISFLYNPDNNYSIWLVRLFLNPDALMPDISALILSDLRYFGDIGPVLLPLWCLSQYPRHVLLRCELTKMTLLQLFISIFGKAYATY